MRISLRDRRFLTAATRLHQKLTSERQQRRRMFLESLEQRHMLAADALNDAGTTNENTVLSVTNPLVGLLSNDTGGPLTVISFQSTSALGATVNVNPDGTYSYDPTAAPALQKLGNGENSADSFTYSVRDNVFTVDSKMRVQLLASAGTVPGNDTNNWLNVFNALDGGGGPTGKVAGYDITVNQSDTETVFNYAGGGNYGGDLAVNSINNDGPGGSAGTFNGPDNYAIRGRTLLRFPAAGTFTIALGSDDGRRISLTPYFPGSAPGYSGFSAFGGQLSGTPVAGNTVFGFSGGTGHDHSVGTFTVAAGDILALDAFYYQGGGGHSGEISLASGTFGDWTNTTDFPLLQGGVHGIEMSSVGYSTDTATVSITVSGVNTAPVANADSYSTNEDTAITVPVIFEVPGMNVAVYNQQGAETGYGTMAGADAVRNTVGRLPNQTGTVQLADFLAGNATTHFAVNNSFPGIGGDNYAVYLTGTLRVTTAGTYTFGVNSDDNSRTQINTGSGFTTVAQHTGCCNDQFGTPIALAVGDYPFEAMYTEGGGGDYGEFFYAPGSFAAFDPAFRLIGDPSGGISSFSSITRPGVLGNDTDEEVDNGHATQNLTVTQLNGGALTGTSSMGAQVTMNPDGSFTYNPNVPGSAVQALAAGQVAMDTFTYTVSDNQSGVAATTLGTAKITVTGRNDLATAKDDSYTTDENTTLINSDVDLVSPRNNKGDTTPLSTTDDGVLVNDTDVDDLDTLQVYSVQGKTLTGNLGTLGDGAATVTTALGGTLTLNDNGTFSYNPATSKTLQALGTGESAVDSFTYTATDGSLLPGMIVKVYQPAGAGDLAQTDAFLAGPRPNQVFNGSRPSINFLNSGGAGQFNGPGTASPLDDETGTPGLAADSDSFVVEVTGKILIPAAGDYTFSVNSDDGFGLDFTGAGIVNLVSVSGDNDNTSTLGTVNPRLRRSTGRGSTDTFGVFNFSAPGLYDLKLVNWEGGGGANVEFFGAPGTHATFGATNTWRLVGDTDNGGLAAFQPNPNTVTATVNITVNGVNTAPVANANSYATSEDVALNIVAVNEVLGMNVLVYDGTGADLPSADSARGSNTTGAAVNPPVATGSLLIADLGTNGDGLFPGQAGVPAPGGGDNYAVFITGVLRINNASNPGNLWTFGTRADDASRIRIDLDQDGILEGALMAAGGETVVLSTGCCNTILGAAVAIPDGDYQFEAVYTEGGGGDYGEFFYAPGNPAFSITNYSLIGDASKGITSFAVAERNGLLGNDTDEEVNLGNPDQNLTVTQLNGGGLTGVSALGAQVTLNADGSFTYNPNVPGSAVQALQYGQIVTDTFTYTVFDNAATGALFTVGNVSITVTGQNDVLIVADNNYATNEDTNIVTTDRDLTIPRNNQGDTTPGVITDDGVLVNEIDVDNLDVLEVRSLQGNPLSGTTGTLGDGSLTALTTLGASVTMNDDGTFTYNPSGSKALQDLGAGQTAVDSFTYAATDNQLVFDPLLNVEVYNQQVGESIAGTFATADLVRGSRAPTFAGTIAQADVVGQPGGHFAINNTLPGTANNTENYAVYVNGVLRVTVAGLYTFGTFSDDNSRIRIDLNRNGNVNDDGNTVTQNGCCNDQFGQVTLSVGDYAFEAMYTEGGGGDFGEFFYAPGSHGGFNSSFRLIGDNSGPILGGRMAPTNFPATVNINVTGVNDNPVAVDDGVYAANENSVLTVTAGAVPGMNVLVYDGTNATLPTADAARGSNTTGAPVNAPAGTGSLLIADIGSTAGGSFAGQSPVPAPGGGDSYAVFMTGILRIDNSANPGNMWTFGTFADDASRIRIDLDQDGILEGALMTAGGETVVLSTGCCNAVIGGAVNIPDGDYAFELVFTEGGGGDYGEFFYAPGNPVFSNTNYALIGDASKGISSFASLTGLMVNDSDRDIGDTISVDTATIISANGATITPLANGSFSYDPATSQAAQELKDGETLTDTFVYTLLDANGGSDTATVTVVVSGVSDPAFDVYSVNEDNPGIGIDLTVPAGTGVLANDALPGDPPLEVRQAQGTVLSGTAGVIGDGSATVVTSGGGQVVIQDNGSFTYDQLGVYNSLPAGQSAIDTFTYLMSGAPDFIPGLNVQVYNQQSGESIAGTFATADAVRAQRAPNFSGSILQADVIGQAGGHFAVNNTLTGTANNTENYAVYINGTLRVTVAGTYTFGTFSDDNSRIRIDLNQNGNLLDDTTVVQQNSCCGDVFGTATLPVGDYAFEAMYTEGGGGDYGEFFYAPGVHAGFNASFKLLGDNTGPILAGQARTSTQVTTAFITVNGVNDAPTAEANGAYSIDAGQNLTVNATGSADVDNGTVLTYRWDFDLDGVYDFTTSSQSAVVPWQTLQTGVVTPLGPGSHTIRLEVSDGSLSATDDATLTISNNFVYTPVQDGVADGYLLILNAAQNVIEIRDTATNTLLSSVPRAGTNQVTFNGTSDNEVLTIDYTNTSPIPASMGVTFMSGTGTDGLVLRNGSVTTVTQNYVTDLNGSINIDGRIVNYTGDESITDNLTAVNRVFNYGGAAETVTLANLVAGTSLQIESTIGANTNFNKPTDTLTVNLSTGSADTLNISSATLTGNFTVNGSDGNDNVNINGAVAVTAGASSPGLVTINGGNLAFTAAGNINAVNNVVLAAGGAITNSGAAIDVTATTLNATAVTNIDLDTSVATLNGAVSSAGGTLRFDEANAVTLQNVSTNNGTLAITTATAGDVTAEFLSSGTAAASITVNNGNLVSGAGDAGVADIVAGALTISLSTGARNIGVSAANRLEINATTLQANIAGGTDNSAWIVDTAGGLAVNNSSLAATGTTVFDLLVQNGSLTSAVVDGTGDLRAIVVIVAVTGAGSTIGASAAAPLEINAATLATTSRLDASTAGGANDHIFVRDVADNFAIGVVNAGIGDVVLSSTFGSIIDNAADAALDITAGRLVMTTTNAAAGIGNGTNGNLEFQAGSLEAATGSSGISLASTGNVTIGGIGSTVGLSATGDIVLTSAGSITVNEDVIASGAGSDVSLTTLDIAAAGQDLNVGPATSVVGDTVTLNAGDNFSASSTSIINASAPLIINIDSGNSDPVGATLAISAGAQLNATSVTFNSATPGAATDIDTFSFAPLATVPIIVNAFNPTSGSGDVLNLDLTGATGTTLTIDGMNDGTYTFANRASVEYNSIEVVNAIAGAYDLVLNMAGFGTPGDFTLRRNSPFVGANLEIVNNADNSVPFSGSLAGIASLTVLGTTGNDRLIVDDVNGMIAFNQLLTPTAVFPDNPNGAGSPRLLFSAGDGVDTFRFDLTEVGATQFYFVGDGAGATAEGEIATTNTAGRNLVAYFTGFGTDGSLITRTGSSPTGAFTVVGDDAANTMTIQASSTATRAEAAGFTPFEIAGNSIGSIGVDGGAGNDTVTLMSIGSGQTNPLNTALSGGADVDTLRVHTTSGNTGTVTMNGGAGSDHFQLFNASNTVDDIAGQVIVDGTDGNLGGNNDTLTIIDSGDANADSVLISAVDAANTADYQIEGINSAPGSDVVFRNIDTLVYTATQGDDQLDTQLVRTTPLHDLSSVTVNGWLGADQFLLFTSDQAGGTAPTPNGMASGVAVFNLNGDAPGNPNGTDGNDVFGQRGTGITGTGSGNVGLTVPDTVRGIRPSISTAININGGQPTGPLVPTGDTIGDVLNLDISGLPGNSAIILPTVSGVVAATGLQPLSYAQIEDMNLIVNNQLINVQMGDTFVRGTAGPDLIQFTKNVTFGSNPNAVRVRVNTLVVDLVLTGKTLTYSGASNDYITQANVARPAEIYGEDGDDYIAGAMGNDFLVGGLGADQINGSGGDNVIWGDNAPTFPGDPNPQDTNVGGSDTLSGLGGNDVFYGGAGDDQIFSGGGNDYLSGGMGNDLLSGAEGDDRIYGGEGNDVLGGGEGNDLLSGGEGNDRLLGNTGNDVLIAGGGADDLSGGSGNDLLISGRVAGENSRFTSVANIATFGAASYSNAADTDAALLTLLTQWSSTSVPTPLAINHDGADDDLWGSTGDDDFCWEAIDLLDDGAPMTPADFNSFGMGNDQRFGPQS